MSRKKPSKPIDKTTRVPSTFSLKGDIWTVVYEWGLIQREQASGLCRFDKKEIAIDRLLSKADKWETFTHELVHAILDGAHLNHTSGLHPKTEEIVCEAISSFLIKNFDIKWKRGVAS